MKTLFYRILTVITTILCLNIAKAQTSDSDNVEHEVVLTTDLGNIRIKLYNDTPLHRDNFLLHVKQGYYDGLLFHRIIPNFVVQGGDSLSLHALPGQLLGDSHEPNKIPAEIIFPGHFHKTGAVAAAREPDEVNPERASSCHQFYITLGTVYDDDNLIKAQEYLNETTNGKVRLTSEIKEVYRTFGGMPYLDGLYTVFGEIVEGLDVVDQMQWVERDEHDRPTKDIHIIEAKQVK